MRISALAAILEGRGARVTVHTGFPNHPDGRIKPPYRNRPYLVENGTGPRIVRSAVYPTANSGFGRRIANHVAFAASAAATSRLSGPTDVVIAQSPPLFTAAAGIAYARLKGAPLVLHVADRWPASAIELGVLKDPRAIRMACALERACYRAAAAIAVPTDGLLTALREVPEADGKVRRIGPYVDTSQFAPRPRPERDGRLRILYAGTVGLSHGIRTLIEAARIAGPDAVEVWIAGDGAEAPVLRERLASEPMPHLRLLGAVPHAHVPRLYSQVDAAVVLLRDRPVFAGALPVKMFEAMAAGRPVVLSARGEAARLVEREDAGLVVPPEDPQALAEALVGLAGDHSRIGVLGEAGRRCAVEAFDAEVAADQWVDLLEEVTDQGGALLKRPRASSRSPVSRGLSASARR
jgi:glycosyltransferase involved in cell wall biosynthesis